jgi:hypothetical protein
VLHTIGEPTHIALALQVSPTVQASPSLQPVPVAAGWLQVPALQLSVVHGLPSSVQAAPVLPTQAPLAHFKHSFVPLQIVPSVLEV